MMRINGFARKTRRSTKGGSLPDKAAERSAMNSDRENHGEGLHPGANGNHGNGTTASDANKNVNRSEYRATSNGHSHENSSGNGSDNGVTRYLHDAIGRFVNSGDSAGVQHNSNGSHASVSTNGAQAVQTIFARALQSEQPANRRAIPLWKRTFDISCILLSLPIWLPLLLVVMLWIKLVSPGPIFYRQERIGYRRGRFRIFKFRTMHVNADTRTHEEYFAHLMRSDRPMTKLDAVDDSRLIRCGRLLRSSGLDELPQIFNILCGDMSLVGPRPCLPNEFERYEPWQQQRVNVAPGLTGYWQVNGKNKTTFSEMIAMDIFYSKNVSIGLDLGIILKTIPALLVQMLESRVGNGSDIAGIPGAQTQPSTGLAKKS